MSAVGVQGPPRPPSAPRTTLLLLLIAAATVAAYWASLDVPFQFDDIQQIVENQAVQSPSPVALLRWARVRILPFVTFALNARVNGANTLGYHLVNLAAHLLATAALFALALALARTPRLRGTVVERRRVALAFAAALLFALHPIQTQAVTYIVQRSTVMAAMFYIGAVWLFVVARNAASAARPAVRRARAAYAGALGCGLAAFLCKENAITLPAMLLLTDWIFFAAPAAAALRRVALFAAPVVLVPALFLLLGRPLVPGRGATLGPIEGGAILVRQWLAPVDGVSPMDYLRTQTTVGPRYLALLAYPRGLNVDHDVAIVRTWSAAPLAGAALVAALIAGAVAVRRRRPVIAYGALWMAVALAVESSVIPLPDVMVEHRLYLPMAGLALAAAAVWTSLQARWPRGAALALALLGLASAIATAARNDVWRSPLGLWQDALAKSPDKPRVIQNVGVLLFQAGRVDEAIDHYCRALKINPDFALARSNLNIALDQRLEAQMDEGDFGAVEIHEGANGVKFVVPKDPCVEK